MKKVSAIFFSLLVIGCSGQTAPSPSSSLSLMDRGQIVFSEPEQAVEVLRTAAKNDDTAAYMKIFGPEAKELLESGDPVADKQGRKRFADAVLSGVSIEREKLESRQKNPLEVAFLLLGKEKLSFPIALIRNEMGWRFDTAVGKEEILNRRIGENEFSVLDLLEEYALAQYEYASEGHDGDAPGYFAPKIVSSPGKHDGLFWEGEPQSPFGPLFADIQDEGYSAQKGPVPVYGYYFRVLTRQGLNARGGVMDFLSTNGKLAGGFSLIAYPAIWGNSGVMTFILGPDGIVFQKNLGPKTGELANQISEFDPDLSWDPA